MSEAARAGPMHGVGAPFPGLRPFEPHEWPIFGGRERTTLDVIARLGERNLVFVHGGSGCGKSSLVRAGVLPAIDRDHRLAGRRFEHAIMRPSEGPLTALDRLLTDRLGEIEGDWAQALIFPDTIVERIEAACAAAGVETFCLVVDQFEEVFRWARENGPEDVQLLADLLGRIAGGKVGRRFFALTTMRSDYLGDCAQFAGLGTIINDCQFFVPNLDDRGLLRSIVDPPRLFGGSVDEALVNRLRFAVGGERDPLPTLQHLLMRMAERKRAAGTPWVIDAADLEIAGAGGIALSRHADELFDRVSGDDLTMQVRMGWLFRALIDRDVGGRGIRRPCSAGELAAVSGLTPEQLDSVLDTFSAEHANLLVVTDPGEGRDARRVDISHEALIRNWRRMIAADGQSGWLAAELDDGLIWRTLAVSARTPNSVLDGATLIEREAWFASFAERPERARRYLIRPEGKPAIADEPEWRSVLALLVRSRAAVDAQEARIAQESAERAAAVRRRRIVVTALVAIVILSTLGWAVWTRYNADKAVVDAQADANAETKSKLIEGSVTSDDQASPADRARTDVVSEETLKTLAPALESVASPVSGDGFIWIGSGTVSYLKVPGPGGARVMPDAVRRGGRYETRYNIVLRQGPPLGGNKTQAAINVVPSGALVTAVSPPQPASASSGTQYWLEISDITPPAATKAATRTPAKPAQIRVYPHIAVDEDGASDRLTAALTARGYNVMGTQVLPQAVGQREVRYCHATDQAAAQKLVDDLYAILPTRAIMRAKALNIPCSKTRPGTIELWIGNP